MRASRIVRAWALAGCGGVSAPAHAQCTAIDLNPPGFPTSSASSIYGHTQGGVAGNHAAIWHGTPETFVDMNPPGATSSAITGVWGDEQVGTALFNGVYYGGLWRGTPESWVALTPAQPYADHLMLGVADGVEVGSVSGHAMLWRGTPESAVDLHPSSYHDSFAQATDGVWQVGQYDSPEGLYPEPALWNGTASSIQTLSHPGATKALAVSDGQVVGYGTTSIVIRPDYALLWDGFSAAPISLNPPTASAAAAFATFHRWQVGYAGPSGRGAALWHSSASSYENLHPSLPRSLFWSESFATGIWTDDATLFVVGIAYNADLSHPHAILWSRPACYANCDSSMNPPVLSVADFLCFESKFAAGDMYANCDGSTAEPRLNVNDFLCFLSKFAAGCD